MLVKNPQSVFNIKIKPKVYLKLILDFTRLNETNTVDIFQRDFLFIQRFSFFSSPLRNPLQGNTKRDFYTENTVTLGDILLIWLCQTHIIFLYGRRTVEWSPITLTEIAIRGDLQKVSMNRRNELQNKTTFSLSPEQELSGSLKELLL